MEISLEINKKQLNDHLKLQYLPASIEKNVEANVDEYFNNYLTKENSCLTNSLRGYPLEGIELEVPPNLMGVVVQESQRTSDENCNKLLKVAGTFEKFTYWNYDKIPSSEDGLRKALEVFSVLDELNKPISAEDIQNEMDRKSKADLESKENNC